MKMKVKCTILLFVLLSIIGSTASVQTPPSNATGFYHWIEMVQGDIPETEEVEDTNVLTVHDTMMCVIPWNVTRVFTHVPPGANLTGIKDVHALYNTSTVGLSSYPDWYYWEFATDVDRDMNTGLTHNESSDYTEGVYDPINVNISGNVIRLQDGINSGEYTSPVIDVADGVSVREAGITLNSTQPDRINLFLSNNNGTDWIPCANDTTITFTTSGVKLRYKVEISGNLTVRPEVQNIGLSYKYTPAATTVAMSADYTISSDQSNRTLNLEKILLYDIQEVNILVYTDENYEVDSESITWLDEEIDPSMSEMFEKPGKVFHIGTAQPCCTISLTLTPIIESRDSMDSLYIIAIILVILIIVTTGLYFKFKGTKQEREDEVVEEDDASDLHDEKEKLLKAIKRLDKDYAEGNLSKDVYDDLRPKYKEKAIDIMKKIDRSD
jgi:hypothetical protein